ncbi:MAG: UDP-N-acetylglucosamine 2-epimerase (non-hydrolyzing) [Flavobacteriaceae bacterium]|nr:UDP-N-acetylglucosamine 2-epimerase (non-hydrolyzing) [Flavobacteriaceae bacterium]
MKILTIIGARPQFIKAASLSREIAKQEGVEEVIVHTGQHFDANMSEVFFTQMQIPKPHYNLAINSLGHGAMTGRMMEEIEKILLTEKPDWLLVYGDTNSTLAGALAAKKLHIKVAHVEAGLRSFNMKMPEEVNRILTDRISDILFCPTQQAIDNLEKEGYKNIEAAVVNIGDIMYDSALFYGALSANTVLTTIPENYILTTVHRAENTDDIQKLKNIFTALDSIHKEFPVVLPLHPRTKKLLEVHGVSTQIHLIEPVGYLEMVSLIKNSKAVITDSGGLQKEAYFFKKQGFTLRDQTEWVELIAAGCNQLIDVLKDDIATIVLRDIDKKLDFSKEIYGDGNTSGRIIEVMQDID